MKDSSKDRVPEKCLCRAYERPAIESFSAMEIVERMGPALAGYGNLEPGIDP